MSTTSQPGFASKLWINEAALVLHIGTTLHGYLHWHFFTATPFNFIAILPKQFTQETNVTHFLTAVNLWCDNVYENLHQVKCPYLTSEETFPQLLQALCLLPQTPHGGVTNDTNEGFVPFSAAQRFSNLLISIKGPHDWWVSEWSQMTNRCSRVIPESRHATIPVPRLC